MISSRFQYAASLIVGLTVLSGCANGSTGNQPSSREQPELGPVTSVITTEGLVLPLDSYRATAEQSVVIETAHDMLIRDCMERFGFSWIVQNRPVLIEANNRYGISDSSKVIQYGYHPKPESEPGKQQAGTASTPSAAEETVFKGVGESTHNGQQVPKGGCRGEAGRALGYFLSEDTSHQDDNEIVRRLDLDSNLAARSDSRLLETWGKWSACMKEKGYDYQTPWDANDDPSFHGPQASSEEILTATADLACRKQVNVIGMNLAIETAYQKVSIERNSEALREAKDRLTKRITLATDKVSGK